MKKIAKSILCLLLIVSCSKAKSELNSEHELDLENSTAVEVDYDEYQRQQNKVDTAEVEISSADKEEFPESNCFKSNNDILKYLIGKTFRKSEAFVTFTEEGGTYSGIRDLKWVSYEIIDGKGFVKLVTSSKDCPDCTYSYWVSCEDNTITTPKSDGGLVYRY